MFKFSEKKELMTLQIKKKYLLAKDPISTTLLVENKFSATKCESFYQVNCQTIYMQVRFMVY